MLVIGVTCASGEALYQRTQGLMMARDWETEFKALNERERLAFSE